MGLAAWLNVVSVGSWVGALMRLGRLAVDSAMYAGTAYWRVIVTAMVVELCLDVEAWGEVIVVVDSSERPDDGTAGSSNVSV